MKKYIYSEPFISFWPMPLSLDDIRECFRVGKAKKKGKRKKIMNNYQYYYKFENKREI